MTDNNLLTFSDENLLKQLEFSEYEFGFYRVKFFSLNGLPSTVKTNTVSDFYLYPSGGALRDENFNIIFYNSKYDIYRGFVPPQGKNTKETI